MNKKIYTFIGNRKNVEKIANDIVEAFKTKANKNNIEYSFDIIKGTGQVKALEPNTFFTFDTEEGTNLYLLKKAMFDDDLSDISKEEEEKIVEDISQFLKKVAKKLEFKKYTKILRNIIREIVLPSSQEKDIPLEKISILAIDVADFSSIPEPAKYLVRIGKIPGAEIKTKEIVKYIHEKQEETNASVEDIFEAEKNINPLFREVTAIQRGDRYLYDINITMFVDYSLSKLPPQEICNK